MGLRILVTRGGGVGDVLLATTVIQPLREKFPRATIHMATESHNLHILDGLEIDRIIPLKSTADVFAFNPEGYDMIYRLHYEKLPQLHILDAFSQITGLDLKDKTPIFKLTEKDRDFAVDLWKKADFHPHHPIIALHRGPTWPIRSWPPERFLPVMNFLKDNYGVHWIELSATPGYFLGTGMDLSGKTTLRQAAAVIQRCSALLCVDSAIMHLASAVGTPVVAIFGGTDPDKRLPRNGMSIGLQAPVACHGCHHRSSMSFHSECNQPTMTCMLSLGPDRVIKALESRLFTGPFPRLSQRLELSARTKKL